MFAALLFILSITACSSFKILVVSPKIGYSHMNFMGSIADALVDAGHEVVTLQPVIFPVANNGTSKSRLIQIVVDEKLTEELLANKPEAQLPTWTASTKNPFRVGAFLPVMRRVTATSVSRLLDDKGLLEQLISEQFDVGISELFDFIGLPVFEAIGLKNVVGAHSTVLMEGTAYAIGVPVIPSYMPATLGITDDSTSVLTRATNILFTIASWNFQTSLASAAESAMKEKLGSRATPIWDIVSNMSWILTNTEPLLDFAKPTIHRIVDIGGIGVHEPKPLDQKWDRILNLRSQAILISFGSVAASVYMPYAMKKTIVGVVKSYPEVTFIWKYEEPSDPFAAGVENLFLSKWTPQGDLLADDRLTLFITHGGAGSMMESAYRGKPLIVVPLFGDQTRNAKLIAKFGFGIMLDKASLLDSAAHHTVIGEVLNDTRYQKAAVRIRDLLAKKPFTPEQKLVKTIELAAEFGDLPELKVAGRNLGLFVYYNIDLISISLIILLFMVCVLLFSVQRLYKRYSLGTKVKKQ